MHQYPSDSSREEYKQIEENLEGARKNTICTMCFVQRCMWCREGYNGECSPAIIPKWQSVYYYFRIWSEKDETGVSVLDKVLQKLVKQIRNEDLRRDKTTFGIVDAQSVQNADTAEEKGYDAGKKYPESSAMLS